MYVAGLWFVTYTTEGKAVSGLMWSVTFRGHNGDVNSASATVPPQWPVGCVERMSRMIQNTPNYAPSRSKVYPVVIEKSCKYRTSDNGRVAVEAHNEVKSNPLAAPGRRAHVVEKFMIVFLFLGASASVEFRRSYSVSTHSILQDVRPDNLFYKHCNTDSINSVSCSEWFIVK